ncbi:hypothetical protein ACWGA9_24855 [Streptomyces sp. NPDC054950]
MRRILAPISAVLLASACTSGSATKPHTDASTPSTTASSDAKGLIGVPTPTGRLVVAIPADRLPYLPEAGMPELDDVKVLKSAADPCGIPADGSGQQAQLLGAIAGGPGTVMVTYSFTNPCGEPLAYSYKLSAAIGSEDGEQAGGGAEGTTQVIEPGQTVKEVVPVDVSEDLTPEQQQKLWVGVTNIGKQASAG